MRRSMAAVRPRIPRPGQPLPCRSGDPGVWSIARLGACERLQAPGAAQTRLIAYVPEMRAFLTILTGLLLLATLGVLIAGMITMVRGGSPERSNRLMRYRVMFQGAAIILLAIMMSMLHS